MCRLFLFLLFSFFISFSVVAANSDSSSNNNNAPRTSPDCSPQSVQKASCTSNILDNHCYDEKKTASETDAQLAHQAEYGTETDIQAANEAFKNKHGVLPPTGLRAGDTLYTLSGSSVEAPTGKAVCDSNEATRCCSDPAHCLGGDALSSFQDVNSVVTKAGPGLAMAMQGMGKDMYKLCQAMQGLAGTGASLSMVAKSTCSKAVSSCESACDYDKQQACEKYRTAKTNCSQIPTTQRSGQANTFDTEALAICNKIKQLEATKTTCTTQRAKAKDLGENVGEMANSALSAELCKQQTQIPKKQCLKNGGKWVDMECIMPEEEEEERPETVALRGSDGTPIPQHTGAQMGISSESPSGDSQGKSSSNSDGNPDSGGGGNPGGPKPVSPLGLPGLAADTGLDSDSDSSTGTGPGRSGISGSSGLAGLGGGAGFSPYKRNQNNEEEEDDDDALSMGGGGFAGYGGGGGFGDGNAYASLGLSKKKLDELKKKKGAKRVTASEAKGTHQNIFERISKRFQSLCQSKLDCR